MLERLNYKGLQTGVSAVCGKLKVGVMNGSDGG